MAYSNSEQGRLRCTLCPHNCLISDGKAGLCRVRGNRAGELELPYYGAISAHGLDPIEKKPLYHFLPGSLSYSLGFWGCNMRCPFCQNYSISQRVSKSSERISPEEAVSRAVASGAASISYTYSEPLIHIEYCLDTAARARSAGLANCLVSNGLINPEPARELFRSMDAVNIDLKSFDTQYYRSGLGGDLEAVKESIAIAAEEAHLEITTLLVPGQNDSVEELGALVDFLASVDPRIVLHISRYFPAYKSERTATDLPSLQTFAAIARKKLSFVYLGNTGADRGDTRCAGCGSLLIRRRGYSTSIVNRGDSECDTCAFPLPYRTRL